MDIEQRYNALIEKIIRIISVAGCLIALLLLADYWLPGKIVEEQLTNKFIERKVRVMDVTAVLPFKQLSVLLIVKKIFIHK